MCLSYIGCLVHCRLITLSLLCFHLVRWPVWTCGRCHQLLSFLLWFVHSTTLKDIAPMYNLSRNPNPNSHENSLSGGIRWHVVKYQFPDILREYDNRFFYSNCFKITSIRWIGEGDNSFHISCIYIDFINFQHI